MFKFKSIRSRIFSITFIPIGIIIVMILINLFEQSDNMNKLGKIQSISELIVQGNALVHELQKERGRTSGYFNSKGSKFSNELTKQRLSTDKELSFFYDILNKTKKTEYLDVLNKDLEMAKQALENLSVIREKVNQFNGVVDEYLKFYTQSIAKILKITQDIESLTNNNINIQKLNNSYYNLLQYKERIGITRATFAGIFSNNAFTKTLYKKAIEVSTESKEYFKNFEFYANQNQLENYKRTLVGDEIQKTENFIKYAMDNSDSPELNINPSEWFDAITVKIDKLKKFEDDLSSELINLSRKYYDRAFYNFLFSIIGGFLLVITMIIFTIYHSNKIVRPIKYAAYIADEISKGNLQNI